MKGPNKRTLVGLLSVPLLLLLMIVWFNRSRSPAIQYETATPSRGDVRAKITASGTLSARVTVQVGSQVSGRIQAIYVDYNSPVKQGQVLAKIDPRLFEAAREQALANHLAAQANLTRARIAAQEANRQLMRLQALAAKNLTAQAEIDTAQANLDGARAEILAAESGVAQSAAAKQQAEVNLGYTTILSPISGSVISRSIDVGQTVAASLQSPTLFTLAEDLHKMQVDTSVAESDVGKLLENSPATFTVDAYPGEIFHGTVRQIRNAPQVLQNVVTYNAVVDADNTELKLRPGMTANVVFVYAEQNNVLRIPNAALRYTTPPELTKLASTMKLQPKQRIIWQLEQNAPQPIVVTPGISDGAWTAVETPDLNEESQVIIGSKSADQANHSGGGRPQGGGGMRRIF